MTHTTPDTRRLAAEVAALRHQARRAAAALLGANTVDVELDDACRPVLVRRAADTTRRR